MCALCVFVAAVANIDMNKDTIFDSHVVQSAASNVINLEVPLNPFLRALKSALQATSASIRLTKKDNAPLLSLTIVTSSGGGGSTPFTGFGGSMSTSNGGQRGQENEDRDIAIDFEGPSRERETIITQDVPIRVLSPQVVEGIHEPRCREPDVHIILPPLGQVRAISERFTRLALASKTGSGGGGSGGFNTLGPRLELSANMHGCLKLAIKTDAMAVQTVWTGLNNPELDPSQVEGGELGISNHPSTRMKALGRPDGKSEEGWATVRIDGRDWGKVLSVGRLGGRVIACFCHEHALILYVYLPSADDGGEESVLTVRV